ncbi:MAG: hypothetical protein FWE37_05735 [Spirochaetaceae bacterium]|nr:hypothetical protein [Spirochaetaceae bacterium]
MIKKYMDRRTHKKIEAIQYYGPNNAVNLKEIEDLVMHTSYKTINFKGNRFTINSFSSIGIKIEVEVFPLDFVVRENYSKFYAYSAEDFIKNYQELD